MVQELSESNESGSLRMSDYLHAQLASHSDEMLMEQVDALIHGSRLSNESVDLSTILRTVRGIEQRRLPFDIAIAAVLEDCVRCGDSLWSASDTLISNYPEFKEQISQAVLISTMLDGSGGSGVRNELRDPPREIGPLLADGVRHRYELVELCGVGASGRTYKSIDRLLSDGKGTCYVAIKLFDVLGTEPEAVAALLAEANRASSINHVNVVQVRDRGNDQNGWAYIAMEYVAGGTLHDWSPSSEDEFLGVAIQLADGLQAIHSGGIIHSDLKPHNVMMFKDEGVNLTPKLTDFGVSRVIEEYGIEDSGTSPVIGYGNVAFQPPEVYEQGERQSVSSDIYALGAMLLYIATGNLVHSGRVDGEALSQDQSDRISLSPRLNRLLLNACSHDASRRPQTCAEFAEHLRSVRDRLPIPQFDGVIQRARLWGMRHPAVGSLTLVAIIAGPILAAGASKAREGWAYERGKQEVAEQVFQIDRTLRPALSARDSVYDVLDSYMLRQLIRDEAALSWLSESAQDPSVRIQELRGALETAESSPFDELLIREQLILHSLQDRAEHPDTSELIALQHDELDRAGLLTDLEAEQIRLYEAVDATKRAVVAHSQKIPWQSERLYEDLGYMMAFIAKRIDSRGDLPQDARRDPRIRLAVRAAEWLSSEKMLDSDEVHERLQRFYLGAD